MLQTECVVLSQDNKLRVEWADVCMVPHLDDVRPMHKANLLAQPGGEALLHGRKHGACYGAHGVGCWKHSRRICLHQDVGPARTVLVFAVLLVDHYDSVLARFLRACKR